MEDAQGNGGGAATAVAMDGGTPPLPPQGGGSEGGAQALPSSSSKLAALSMTTPLLQMTMNEVPRHCGLLNQALQETEDPTPYVVVRTTAGLVPPRVADEALRSASRAIFRRCSARATPSALTARLPRFLSMLFPNM